MTNVHTFKCESHDLPRQAPGDKRASYADAAAESRDGIPARLSAMHLVCTTAVVCLSAAALTPDEGDSLRCLAVTVAAFAVLTLASLCRAATRATAVASAYSAETSGPFNGCDHSRLHDRDLSVATFLVPCGARIRVCLGRRCVIAVRRDSGPFVAGRQIDLNLGVVRALGFRSCAAFGVRTVTWSRA